MSGWIKLHRKLLEWEWYSKPVVKSVFIHCLLKANHKDGKWQGKDIKRGSFISSVDKFISELGHSRQEIRTAIKHLKSTNELTTDSGSQHTVFKVINYELYQELTNDQPTTNQRLTNDQPTANQRSTTNNNDKKEKNDKNEREISNLPTDGKPPASKKFNDEDVRFAEWFYQGLLNNNPQHKKPNFESNGWADAVRLMRERDGRNYDQMADLARWTLNDGFWKANVLSPSKLREKWDQLTVKMKQPQPQQRPTKHGVDDNNWVDGLINGELL